MKSFAKFKLSLPLPDLVKPPAPVILTVETVTSLTPLIVRDFPEAVVMPPVSVILPVSAVIVESLPRVIAPL